MKHKNPASSFVRYIRSFLRMTIVFVACTSSWSGGPLQAQESQSILERPVESPPGSPPPESPPIVAPAIQPPLIQTQQVQPPPIQTPSAASPSTTSPYLDPPEVDVLPGFNDATDPSAYRLQDADPQVAGQNAAAETTSSESMIDIDRLLTRLVLDAIPHTYEEDKDWGGQKERFAGLEIERDGLRIETRRKRKLVNHGTWKKYSAQLVNPNEEFRVRVDNMHQTESGKTGFDVHFTANVDLQARQAKWVRGVQLYSISAEGHATIRLVVECELGVTLGLTSFPPDLIFSPEAKSAEIIVDEFRIDRISKLGGEFAQQVSRKVRRELDRKVNERERKLVDKINKELEENSDKLRLSVADAIKSKWSGPARAFLPAPVQSALDSAGR